MFSGYVFGSLLMFCINSEVLLSVDQRSLMFSTGISKVLSLIFVRHITDTKNPCVLVLTRCHVIHINHVLTPCHVTEINYELR